MDMKEKTKEQGDSLLLIPMNYTALDLETMLHGRETEGVETHGTTKSRDF